MKKWLLAMALGLLLSLAACGGSDDAVSTETDEPVEEQEATEEEAEAMDEEEDASEDAETSDEGTEVAEGDVVEPEQIYKDSCASCHSGDFDFGAGEVDLSVEEIEDLILNGIGNMPAIDVSEEEANALAVYLSSQ